MLDETKLVAPRLLLGEATWFATRCDYTRKTRVARKRLFLLFLRGGHSQEKQITQQHLTRAFTGRASPNWSPSKVTRETHPSVSTAGLRSAATDRKSRKRLTAKNRLTLRPLLTDERQIQIQLEKCCS